MWQSRPESFFTGMRDVHHKPSVFIRRTTSRPNSVSPRWGSESACFASSTLEFAQSTVFPRQGHVSHAACIEAVDIVQTILDHVSSLNADGGRDLFVER